MLKASNQYTKNIGKLGIDPKLLSMSAVNQYVTYNSASRSVMMLSHMSQMLSLKNPEPRIVKSGLEEELGKTLFDRKVENDSMILGVIPRYRSLTNEGIDSVVEVSIIYLDLVKNEIDILVIPKIEQKDLKFGSEFAWSSIIEDLSIGETVPAGTVFAQTTDKTESGEFAFGLNVNTAIMSFPESGEDAVIISKSLAKRLGFKMWVTREFSVSQEHIPLNIYGDDDNYKIIPDIGERVHESGILVATRKVEEEYYPVILKRSHLKDPDPMFDNCTYVLGNSGIVTDVKVFKSPKRKQVFYEDTVQQLDRYANSMTTYQNDVLAIYNDAAKEFPEAKTGSELHRMVVDFMSFQSPKFTNTWRKDVMRDYTVFVTIEYDISEVEEGKKITDMAGAKGIISMVIPDEDRPVDKNGVAADLILATESTSNRANPGRLYDMYFNGASREVQRVLRLKASEHHAGVPYDQLIMRLSNKLVNELFNHVLGFLELVNQKQFEAYSSLKNMADKKEIIHDILVNEFYFYLPVNNKPTAYEIVSKMMHTKYTPLRDKVTYHHNGELHTSEEDVMIAPLYTLLLNKIADTWLATPSAKVNHFGVPVGTNKSNKYRLPWADNPVKIISETEGRLFTAYGGTETLAEMRDRATNMETHKRIYHNILTAPIPTNIIDVADRDQHGYQPDGVVKTINAIYATSGFKTIFIDEEQ